MMEPYRPKPEDGGPGKGEVKQIHWLETLSGKIKDKIIQLGGNETVGYGFVKMHRVEFAAQTKGGANGTTSN